MTTHCGANQYTHTPLPGRRHASFVYQQTRRVIEFVLGSHEHSEDEVNPGGIRDMLPPK